MPVYEYECPREHINERRFPIASFPQSVECWCGDKAKKIISRFNFGNSPEFQKQWHPEECNAQKDIKHWQNKHGKNFYDV